MSEKPLMLFDKRVLERNLKNNRITRKEYDAYVKRLPDVTNKGMSLFEQDELSEESEAEK